MKQKFFKCKHCGNIITFIKESGVPVICCGEKMHELVPGTQEASVEKHIPVYQIKDNILTVTISTIYQTTLTALKKPANLPPPTATSPSGSMKV